MGKLRTVTPPVHGARVTQEDVGHTSSSSSTHTHGYTRKNKTHAGKALHGSSVRKTESGHISGNSDSTEEDESNGDDEASSDEIDDNEADDEEPGNLAPSDGAQQGNQDDEDLDSDSAGSDSPIGTANHQAGQSIGIGALTAASNGKRKRTTSELTTNTVLSTTELDSNGITYPRKRVERRLSNNSDGLLKYGGLSAIVTDNEDDEIDMSDYEQAIQSSDEEDEVTLLDQLDDSQDTDVEQLEEMMIIQEESARLAAGKPDDTSSVDGRTNDPLDSDDETHLDLSSFWSSGYGDSNDYDGNLLNFAAVIDDEEDIDLFTPRPTKRTQSDVSARRVRFDETVQVAQSSRESSTETDLNVFPDLMDGDTFAAQDNLPTSLRDGIENDIDFELGNASASDTDGSCWDFGEEEASANLFAWHDVDESESDGSESSEAGLDGYDSDGDTTDDDLPPPRNISTPKSLLHRRSPSTLHSATATPKPFPRGRRTAKGPVMGSFVVDEQKAMAFIDPNTRQLKIHRARAPFVGATRSGMATPGSTTSNSPQVLSQNLAYESDNSDLSHGIQRPFDVMMSGVFGGLPGQRYQDGRFVMEANGPMLIGPPEAFYPFVSARADGTIEVDSDDFDTEDDSEIDCNIIDAFLNMGDYEDEEEPEIDEEESTSPPPSEAADKTPAQKRSVTEHLIRNFDRGIVSSFRNNQDRSRQLSGLPHTGNRAAPVRDGRTAEDLMTPPRKRKRSSAHDNTTRRAPPMGRFR
ncbi:hypothetical protein FKW77_006280 [Venturia effusa]|uniref:Uncharacterized protein n=1 Tax=Venturia effusa TaxID=50376 RepID=A0A517LIW6_9PEZI|nr:hypothetical protein FKW77_006280 [Venturia effusa]